MGRKAGSTSLPETPQELDRWQFEHGLTLDLVLRIEKAERARLTRLGVLSEADAWAIIHHESDGVCWIRFVPRSVDLAEIESRLRTWKPRRPSDRPAAIRSFFTLAELANIEHHLHLGHDNARLAAAAALRAGLLASESVALDLLTQMRSNGGNQAQRAEKEENRALILAELRDPFDRHEAKRIADITRLDPSTVREHLKEIRLKRGQVS